MPSITADRLTFAYLERAPIFADTSFCVSCGFSGVVGANGSDKATLARLIAGELEPVSGSLRLEPRAAAVLVCEQRVESLTEQVKNFAEDKSGIAARLRGCLLIVYLAQELETADISSLVESVRLLSHVERGRLLSIVAALGVDPDRLLRLRSRLGAG